MLTNRAALLASIVVLSNACSSNPPSPTDVGTSPFLAVAGSDFQSGALGTIDLASSRVQKNLDILDAQPVVRSYGKQLFILDQTHGSMRIYDVTQGFANPSDYPLGKMPEVPATQANPYDIYVDAPHNIAYVTLYGSLGSTVITGSFALGVIDLGNPTAGIIRFVALPVAAGDPDNNPEAARLAFCGDKLLLLLQDLDRTRSYQPVGPGRLALIDLNNPPQTAATVPIVQLAGQNPTALSVLPGCTQAIVGSAGDQLSGTLDGNSGIEVVDLVNRRSLGLLLNDMDFGGNISTLDAIDVHNVFVDISSRNGSIYNNDVYYVDTVSKAHGQKIIGPLSFVPVLRVFSGKLVVGAAGLARAGQLNTGLYVGAADGSRLSNEPFDLGLPPISVDLVIP